MTDEELAQQAKEEEILKPKTEEQLREEIIGEYQFDADNDTERIDKILELRKDRFTATRAKRDKAEEAELAKKEAEQAKQDLAKLASQGKQPPIEPKGTELIPLDDKAMLYADGKSKQAVAHLENVIRLLKQTKPDATFEDALNDPLYTAWEQSNQAIATRRTSQLDASRGGGQARPDEVKKQVDSQLKNHPLPKGFKYNPDRNVE